MAQAVTAADMQAVTDLAGVEPLLAQLRGGDRSGSVRATTLNLVVHAPTPGDVNSVADALTMIAGSRPLRALVVTPAEGEARATVTSSCWLSDGGQEVCSEQVVIEAEPQALPSAVVGLLVPDLPVFLLWMGGIGGGRPLLDELAELVTRVIVDSDACGLEAAIALASSSVAVSDIAWARLQPWREALAMLADAPAGLEAFRHSIGIEVRGPENEALLLAGWLRSRLDRQLGVEQTGRVRAVERVGVHSGGHELVVERSGRGELGHTTGIDGLARPVVLPRHEFSRLLGAELDQLGADRVFEQALAAAS
jgi:glucose-6-phosphate dehydrogenase assembly protein OpcA